MKIRLLLNYKYNIQNVGLNIRKFNTENLIDCWINFRVKSQLMLFVKLQIFLIRSAFRTKPKTCDDFFNENI